MYIIETMKSKYFTYAILSLMIIFTSCKSIDNILVIDSQGFVVCDQTGTIQDVSVAVKRLENISIHQDRSTGFVYISKTNTLNELTLQRVDKNFIPIGSNIKIDVSGKVRSLYIESNICYISSTRSEVDQSGEDNIYSYIQSFDLSSLKYTSIAKIDALIIYFILHVNQLYYTSSNLYQDIIGSFKLDLLMPEEAGNFSNKRFRYSSENTSISYVTDSSLFIKNIVSNEIYKIDKIDGLDIENIIDVLFLTDNVLLINYLESTISHKIMWGIFGSRYSYKQSIYLLELNSKNIKKIRTYTNLKFIELVKRD